MSPASDRLSILSLQYYSFPDEIGGAWKVSYELNRRLVRRGHEVFLITCKPGHHLVDHETVDGIFYERIGVRASKSFLGLWRGIRKRVGSIFARSPVNLVHIHNPLVGFIALLVFRLWSVPRIYHFHSCWYDEEKINRQGESGLLFFLSLNLIRLMEWTCFLSAKKILFLSEYSRRRFLDYCPWRKTGLEVIPGGVDIDEFRPLNPEESLEQEREKLGLPGNKTLLLTVRRLESRMGLENLVQAVGMICQRSPEMDFILLIGGKGSLEEKLKSLVEQQNLQDRVRLCGKIPQETLPTYYRVADVFILPTTFIEGFGLATVEALASGVPVLGTPVGGTVEILKSIDQKLLFRGIGPESLADGIEGFLRNLRDEPSLQVLKKNCRDTAVFRYEWEKVTDRIEHVFIQSAANRER